MTAIASGRLGPRAAEGDQDREGARGPGAEVGDVAAEEGDDGDRPGSGTPSSSAPAPTSRALQAATIVTPTK